MSLELKELRSLLEQNKDEPIVREILDHIILIQKDKNFVNDILQSILDEDSLMLIENLTKTYALSILFSVANNLTEKGIIDVRKN